MKGSCRLSCKFCTKAAEPSTTVAPATTTVGPVTTVAGPESTTPWPTGPCHTATSADADCYAAVTWIMKEGYFAHMDWYPGLKTYSPFEAFQAKVHADDPAKCPQPCKPPPQQCKNAVAGDACYQAVTWAKNDAIYANPTWFPELKAGVSSQEEFQAHLHMQNASLCPLPCMPK